MKRKTILGTAVVLVLSIITGVAFVYVAKDYRAKKRREQFKKEVSQLKRKLAFSSDPDRNLARAEKSEAKSDWKNALYYYDFLANNLPPTDPRKGYAFYKKALCYYNLNDIPRAKSSVEYALNHFPDMSQTDQALFLIAKIYINLEQYGNADKTYQTIIRIFPHRAEEAKKMRAMLPGDAVKAQQEAQDKRLRATGKINP